MVPSSRAKATSNAGLCSSDGMVAGGADEVSVRVACTPVSTGDVEIRLFIGTITAKRAPPPVALSAPQQQDHGGRGTVVRGSLSLRTIDTSAVVVSWFQQISARLEALHLPLECEKDET